MVKKKEKLDTKAEERFAEEYSSVDLLAMLKGMKQADLEAILEFLINEVGAIHTKIENLTKEKVK